MTQLAGLHAPLVKHSATVLVASADTSFQHRVRQVLEDLRWQVHQAAGGAAALLYLDDHDCEALILDSWLPDLEVDDLIAECQRKYPHTDLLTEDMSAPQEAEGKNRRRQELLYALRRSSGKGETKDAVSSGAQHPAADGALSAQAKPYAAELSPAPGGSRKSTTEATEMSAAKGENSPAPAAKSSQEQREDELREKSSKLPELIGSSPAMLELCREIRLVAPRHANVLIEGPTGSGKELVAHAIHRLSPRADGAFIVMNCAAIPETLLEAELFGYAKGAFTGALQSRVGRLEAARGGTLFLDEIGEMPLALQPKLLRFLEQGELQRIGENESIRVDVRVVAATHRRLEQSIEENSFRADLYFRLAVFPLSTPSLLERLEDIPELAEHFLHRLAAGQPVKRLQPAALEQLLSYDWLGGVRELQHVLERACILAEDRPEIAPAEIRLRNRPRPERRPRPEEASLAAG